MKTSGASEIKKELDRLSAVELKAVIARLARFRKENKELLHYLLFEAEDEAGYVHRLKEEIDLRLGEVNTLSTYYLAKSIRKIVRFIALQARYSGKAETEAQLLLHFLQAWKSRGDAFFRSTALQGIFDRQIVKTRKKIGVLHEDLQFDYYRELENLTIS
jgi:hypothetical protein